MPGATLDTGALIVIERGDRRLRALLDEANLPVLTSPLRRAWSPRHGAARWVRRASLD